MSSVITYVLLISGAIGMLIPFVSMISGSLKTDPEIQHIPPTLMPHDPQWHNYSAALGKDQMDLDAMAPEKMDLRRTSLPNTVVITVCCVLGQIISSSLVGYGFARFRFRGKNALFLIMLSTMMLPAQVTMIPLFILFRWLGWIDTFLPLIVPAWLAGPFFVFMFRQFFAAIPEELMEAARIDGAGTLRIYWQIMMPLCGPVIAITATGMVVALVAMFRVLGGQVTSGEPGVGWAAAWYGTVVTLSFLIMYFFIYDLQ